jgi:hypothetical protein
MKLRWKILKGLLDLIDKKYYHDELWLEIVDPLEIPPDKQAKFKDVLERWKKEAVRTNSNMFLRHALEVPEIKELYELLPDDEKKITDLVKMTYEIIREARSRYCSSIDSVAVSADSFSSHVMSTELAHCYHPDIGSFYLVTYSSKLPGSLSFAFYLSRDRDRAEEKYKVFKEHVSKEKELRRKLKEKLSEKQLLTV